MSLRAEGISITYESADGRRKRAVSDVDITIATGEFVSVIGPSGCGKSTLLHCVGGMLAPTAGRVTLDGAEVREPDPARAAFVFQDYSLYPWKSVLDNAAIGLRFAGVDRRTRRERAMRQLELVGLAEVAHSYPSELSGGMQQRVAVARALTMEPDILLMDEPFGALDEQSRRRLGVEMSRILTAAGKTVVMVTHSLDEAVYWADRVLVLSRGPGRVIQDIRVEGPRPRTLDFMTTPAFDAQRVRLFTLLEHEYDEAERTADRPAAEEPPGAGTKLAKDAAASGGPR
ncbi:ABC transporter ATP-binding protein [Streptomyces sp. NPDC050560]|uniref:ABC transporter ATP-binding protein n=1 Tax=Streptomyces sp. NPDC050560 TaxID=3365630 RepID=UPI0037BE0A4E